MIALNYTNSIHKSLKPEDLVKNSAGQMVGSLGIINHSGVDCLGSMGTHSTGQFDLILFHNQIC